MPTILQQALGLLVGDQPVTAKQPAARPLKKLTDRQLIRLESQIGSTLFGPVPKGRSRDFFCLDAETWVWHESWKDDQGKFREQTVRYEVHPHGILKIEDGGKNHSLIKGQELTNFTLAVRMYHEQVAREIYHRDPKTGKPLNQHA